MKLEELEQQYEELGAEIARLKAAPKPWPQASDVCFSVSWGAVIEITWCDCTDYQNAFSIGNVFRTREEAEAELECRKVIHELRMCNGAKPFVVDEENWFVSVGDNVLIEIHWTIVTMSCALFSIYFSSKESVQAAIKKVGEARLLKAAKWQAMRGV